MKHCRTEEPVESFHNRFLIRRGISRLNLADKRQTVEFLHAKKTGNKYAHRVSGVPFDYFVFGHYSNESRRGDSRDGYRQFDEALAKAQKLRIDPQCTDVAVVRLLMATGKALLAVLKGEVWAFQPELIKQRGLSLEVKKVPDGDKWPFSKEDETSPPPVTGTHPAFVIPHTSPAA